MAQRPIPPNNSIFPIGAVTIGYGEAQNTALGLGNATLTGEFTSWGMNEFTTFQQGQVPIVATQDFTLEKPAKPNFDETVIVSFNGTPVTADFSYDHKYNTFPLEREHHTFVYGDVDKPPGVTYPSNDLDNDASELKCAYLTDVDGAPVTGLSFQLLDTDIEPKPFGIDGSSDVIDKTVERFRDEFVSPLDPFVRRHNHLNLKMQSPYLKLDYGDKHTPNPHGLPFPYDYKLTVQTKDETEQVKLNRGDTQLRDGTGYWTDGVLSCSWSLTKPIIYVNGYWVDIGSFIGVDHKIVCARASSKGTFMVIHCLNDEPVTTTEPKSFDAWEILPTGTESRGIPGGGLFRSVSVGAKVEKNTYTFNKLKKPLNYAGKGKDLSVFSTDSGSLEVRQTIKNIITVSSEMIHCCFLAAYSIAFVEILEESTEVKTIKLTYDVTSKLYTADPTISVQTIDSVNVTDNIDHKTDVVSFDKLKQTVTLSGSRVIAVTNYAGKLGLLVENIACEETIDLDYAFTPSTTPPERALNPTYSAKYRAVGGKNTYKYKKTTTSTYTKTILGQKDPIVDAETSLETGTVIIEQNFESTMPDFAGDTYQSIKTKGDGTFTTANALRFYAADPLTESYLFASSSGKGEYAFEVEQTSALTESGTVKQFSNYSQSRAITGSQVYIRDNGTLPPFGAPLKTPSTPEEIVKTSSKVLLTHGVILNGVYAQHKLTTVGKECMKLTKYPLFPMCGMLQRYLGDPVDYRRDILPQKHDSVYYVGTEGVDDITHAAAPIDTNMERKRDLKFRKNFSRNYANMGVLMARDNENIVATFDIDGRDLLKVPTQGAFDKVDGYQRWKSDTEGVVNPIGSETPAEPDEWVKTYTCRLHGTDPQMYQLANPVYRPITIVTLP